MALTGEARNDVRFAPRTKRQLADPWSLAHWQSAKNRVITTRKYSSREIQMDKSVSGALVKTDLHPRDTGVSRSTVSRRLTKHSEQVGT